MPEGEPTLDEQIEAVKREIEVEMKTCPFCDTKAVQQVRLADSDTEMQFRIGCGNPFCAVEPNTPPYAALRDAEEAWQERVPSPETPR